MCCLLYIGLGAARSHHSGEHNVARPKGFVHFHAIFLGGAHIFFAQQSAVDAIQNHISDAGDDTLGEALVQHRDAGCHDVARHRNYCLAAARLHIDRAKLKYKGLIYCFNKLTPRFNYKRNIYIIFLPNMDSAGEHRIDVALSIVRARPRNRRLVGQTQSLARHTN